MARLYFPVGRNPIGMRVAFDGGGTGAQWWTIVGIVEVVTQEGLDASRTRKSTCRSRRLSVAQCSCRSRPTVSRWPWCPCRQVLKGVDADLPMNDVRSMGSRVADSIAAPRVSVVVLSLFAGLAMVLAGVGIYGVLSYAVSQRTRRLNSHGAGASSGSVRRLIVRQGMKPAMIGLGVGLVGAYWGTRLMTKLLFGIAPTDPATFAVVAVFLSSVAFLASYVPARRATRVAPTEALRFD
jgi:hypothetical protein